MSGQNNRGNQCAQTQAAAACQYIAEFYQHGTQVQRSHTELLEMISGLVAENMTLADRALQQYAQKEDAQIAAGLMVQFARRQMGYSQPWLAQLCGVNRMVVAQIELGQMAPPPQFSERFLALCTSKLQLPTGEVR